MINMRKINARELAALLDGREFGREITEAEEQLAKENGLVVAFRSEYNSTDFRGAFHSINTHGRLNPVCVMVNKKGIIDNQRVEITREPHVAIIEEIRHSAEYDNPRIYNTSIPHASFRTVYNDGSVCCVGIVFNVDDLPNTLEEELATLAQYRAICPDPKQLKAELERLKQVEAERDAAVRDIETILRTGVSSCAVCKWITKDGCSKWKPTAPCCEIAEWRGVQATPKASVRNRREDPCLDCDCYDPDLGCTMESVDRIYACPETGCEE